MSTKIISLDLDSANLHWLEAHAAQKRRRGLSEALSMTFCRRGPITAFSVLFSTLFSLSVALGASTDETRWQPDDLLLDERVRDAQIAPDGSFAVWSQSSVVTTKESEDRVSHLRLRYLEPGGDGELPPIVELTRGAEGASAPQISPDGRHVAFLSGRDLPPGGPPLPPTAKPQVWAIPVGGGEAFPVTRFERGIQSYAWTSNEGLVVLAQETPTAYANKIDKAKDTSQVIDNVEHEPPTRLFRVPLQGKPSRLTANDDWIESLDVSPDGRHAVVVAQQYLRYAFDQKIPPHTYLVDLESGTTERLFESTSRVIFNITWAPASDAFFFSEMYTTHPQYTVAGIFQLHRYDLESGTAEQVDTDWDRGLGGGYAPTPDGVAALLANGVRYRPVLYTRGGDGWTREDLEGAHVTNLDALDVSADGRRVLYRHSSATQLPQHYTARLEGNRLSDVRQVTEINTSWAKRLTGKAETITWTGALGDTVEGMLHYPLDWQEGAENGRRPLVLDIHGGPLGADRDTWRQSYAAPNILWRQRGAFVLEVNYHGSAGYGLEWAESIAGHYYEYEIPDIESGVDHLIERGLVDPERLGSSGWSNGGILTAGLIVQTQRYKAAVVGAADVEWISDWANVDFGASFDNYYFGSTPWDDVEHYIEKSPFFRLGEVTTPTIIHTGTEDRNVPPHQSWSLYRALQFLEQAPTRLITYPGEPHGLRKIAHQRRKLNEDLAWFDRYLFATEEAENEALQKDSLLAALLHRGKAARRSDGAWGTVDANGGLIPETASFAGLEVGRFEVTQAQWAAWTGEEPALGTANHPQVGVSFQDAQAYVAWLSETTGRTYRLPAVEEAERLAKAAAGGGNTLDRWAGYTPNPDDAERLAAELAKLEGAAPLLLAVGSLAGDGKVAQGQGLVFDLDGNAAEWAVEEDGTGAAKGPSAERSTDPLGSREATPAYVGLRVIEGDEPESQSTTDPG